MSIGIISAMPEELHTLIPEICIDQVIERGMRSYYVGTLWGHEVVLVFSRWGKVAASVTATHLILEFGVKEIYFTGVAGALDSCLSIGDVVIGNKLVNHDIDARPLFPRYEVPLLDMSFFSTNTILSRKALLSAKKFLQNNREFGIDAPKAVEGLIVSGDKFLANRSDRSELKSRFPDASCIEMEGAAVAQVCYEYSVPFSVIRTISDEADESAKLNFSTFVRNVASLYSLGILKGILTEEE